MADPLEREITTYPEAMEAFHPDLTPFSGQLRTITEETVALGKQSSEKQDYMIIMLEQLTASQRADTGEGKTAIDTSSAADEAIEQGIHREIDSYRDLLRKGTAETAKELLESLKSKVWESASARVRFRIVTNIGAACLELDEGEAAAKAFLEAIEYDPEDRVGLANVALAHLLRAESEQAVAAAAAALQRDPANAAAAGYLISGYISDRSLADPFSMVPEGLRESAEVLASAINFLSQRGDASWRALARQDGRVAAFLEGNIEALSGSPQLKMELAQWLDHFGHGERARKLGYSVFLGHSRLPRVPLKYIGLLLRPGRPDAVPLETESIDDHTAFEIDDGAGGKAWFVIEPEVELRKDETYIAPDDELARKSRGLRAGDKISWDDQGPRREWTVRTVKHKYIHALHQSMEKFERHFPTEHGLRRVSIDLDADEPFEEIFKDVKGRHDSIQGVFDVCNEQLIPIHVAAGALGTDIVETRYALQQSGRAYRVCEGTEPERAQALVALHSNEGRGCVIDALTLTFVRRLGLEQAVEGVCGPIGLTGSTRDVFWHRIHEMQQAGGPTASLFWRDGCYYRNEPTQEEWDQALGVREADLAWIDEHTTILPAEGSADPPEELRRLNAAIGNNFIDDMLAAQGSDRLLLSQDQAYRALAAQHLGLRTSWLQPVLMVARDNGLMSRDEYDRAILAFIDFRDLTVAIDSGVLVAATQEEEGSPHEFKLVASLLGGPKAEMLSHIGVAVDFLGFIWSERPEKLATARQTGMILENLLKGRTDWRTLIAVLRRIHRRRFGIDGSLDKYVLRWLQGHFLVPFEERTLPLIDIFKPPSRA